MMPGVADANFAVDENSANGTVVGEVVATDIDGEDVSFQLQGADAAPFAVDADGVIRVIDSALLDFETQSVFSFSVTATDASLAAGVGNVVVTLNDVFGVRSRSLRLRQRYRSRESPPR